MITGNEKGVGLAKRGSSSREEACPKHAQYSGQDTLHVLRLGVNLELLSEFDCNSMSLCIHNQFIDDKPTAPIFRFQKSSRNMWSLPGPSNNSKLSNSP